MKDIISDDLNARKLIKKIYFPIRNDLFIANQNTKIIPFFCLNYFKLYYKYYTI